VFEVREKNGCVDYVISIARVALGYSPQLPFKPQDEGIEKFGIIGTIGLWFPNHKVRVWSDSIDAHAPRARNVEHMGQVYHYDHADDSILMYVTYGESEIGHMAIGLPTPDSSLIIAVEVFKKED